MTLPQTLIDKIKQGKVVLLLGSGALYGAKLAKDNKIPLGNELRNILCDKFLRGDFKDRSLKFVSELSISQYSLSTVQDFIKDYLWNLEPAEFHLKIPLFHWRALFTTNYDRLLEICYDKVKSRVQTYTIILSNDDRLDETRITNDKVPIIKLHGCITRTHDQQLPLVLTTEQYNDTLEINRDRLFSHLYDLAYENSIVFVGHSLEDHNISYILEKLNKQVKEGQRHYLLKPNIKDVEKDYWAQKKITALNSTFEQFLVCLENNISNNERVLSLVRPSKNHPIQAFFADHTHPSDELVRFLTEDVELVSDDLPITLGKAKDFYRGLNQGWYPLSENLAISRRLGNEIFEKVIEGAEANKKRSTELIVIKGEAGSGKTILLRQIAWKSRNTKLGIFLWVKQNSSIDVYIIEEIIEKTKERVFIFWDDASTNIADIYRFLVKAQKKNLPITIFTAERYNEWNTKCKEELDELVSELFELKYLSENEIELLLEKLEKYDSLGPNLINKNRNQQQKELREVHGRQLLVALHEATMGERFEDIIFDEYVSITPEGAKSIYLTICTLYRLRIPIRAGLISRIYDVSFDDFRRKFYAPLEKVVFTVQENGQDYHYIARHPEIAEIVFRTALAKPDRRLYEYRKIISKLNIAYSSDKTSFRSMIRAKTLHELFATYEDVKSIYEHALECIGDDPYLLQQMAIYERIRDNGNLQLSIELLLKAKDLARFDYTILHTIATIYRELANRTTDIYKKNKFRNEAKSFLKQVITKQGTVSSYISASQIEVSLDILEDLLSDQDSLQSTQQEIIRNTQKELSDHQRKYPTDSYTNGLELRLSILLNDQIAAIKTMEKSFDEQNMEPFLAIRLAKYYQDNDQSDKAIRVLKLALERHRNNQQLYFHYAELTRLNGKHNGDELVYYYYRSFTPNDSNYYAQFWYARYKFMSHESKENQEANNIFDNLRKASLSFDERVKIRDYEVNENGGLKNFTGTIIKKRQGFGFIEIDGFGFKVFFPDNFLSENRLRDSITEGERVKLNIGYSFKGPIGCNIELSI